MSNEQTARDLRSRISTAIDDLKSGMLHSEKIDRIIAALASPSPDATAGEVEILRRALAWHGDPVRMATTREEWQQVIDAAILWVKENPEPDRLSFPSFRDTASPSPDVGKGEKAGDQCESCQGNGEVVTDWDRYLHAHEGDKGDEAVAECSACEGTGRLPSPEQGDVEKLIEAAQNLRAWPIGMNDLVDGKITGRGSRFLDNIANTIDEAASTLRTLQAERDELFGELSLNVEALTNLTASTNLLQTALAEERRKVGDFRQISQDMLDAGENARIENTDRYLDGSEIAGDIVPAIWEAMLSVALSRTAPAESLGNEVIRSAPKNSAESRAVGRGEIAEKLFQQRQPPYEWDEALDAKPESDAGTLVSICFDDADAILALFAGGE